MIIFSVTAISKNAQDSEKKEFLKKPGRYVHEKSSNCNRRPHSEMESATSGGRDRTPVEAGGRGRGSLDELAPLVYEELRRLAARHMQQERADHTLQPTALVSEVYLALVGQKKLHWQNRAQFMAIAAQTMRHILVDYARSRQAWKRGGGRQKVTLNEAIGASAGPVVDVLELDEALNRLDALDPQKSRIVELRYFAGMTVPETAEALGISASTVKRGWSMARAWLHRELYMSSSGIQ
jgi:RNA polymerase sigma factor (TIGR02999 family)